MRASGVEIRAMRTATELHAAEDLLARVWITDKPPLGSSTMMALSHTGNYVAGAYRRDAPSELVGCLVGFFGPPDTRSLHSQIAGVDPGFAGAGVGTALKRHERAWCHDLGITSMTWTFDPAIARNAYFNIARLGVGVTDYLDDFYGARTDGINSGSPTDRLLVTWDLTMDSDDRVPPAPLVDGAVPALVANANGGPLECDVDPSAPLVLVGVPHDIELMRRADPAMATAWRIAIRRALSPYIESPKWKVTGFMKNGSYVVERAA